MTLMEEVHLENARLRSTLQQAEWALEAAEWALDRADSPETLYQVQAARYAASRTLNFTRKTGGSD